jgi:hypothetical protein
MRNKSNNSSTTNGTMKNAAKFPLFSMATASALLFSMALCTSTFADVYWNDNNGELPGGDRNWANAANWINGLPSAPGAGSAIVKPWYLPSTFPLVSTAGNTANQIYIDTDASLGITGGDLSAIDLVTGVWGNSGMVTVSGGNLNLSGLLNMGQAGYDGDVSISSGRITAGSLSIQGAGTILNISGTGSFAAPSAPNLGNIDYWINNSHNITANGGAAGWSINEDTTTMPGYVILTAVAVPEPSTFALFGLSLAFLGFARRRS